MPTLQPCLWFEQKALEAVNWYTTLFPDSRLHPNTRLPEAPKGGANLVRFELGGQPFQAIQAKPGFPFHYSVSFMVNFDPSRIPDARNRLDVAWASLAEGGEIMMPLDEYFFSPRYGWIQDQYGLSWQLILTDPAGDFRPTIMPVLLFVGPNCGRAEEARTWYTSVFSESQLGNLQRYGPDQPSEQAGTVMFSDFRLADTWFVGMDSARSQGAFTEATSFVITCENQEEIDYYWDKLSSVPEAEQCGWLKDPFGLSWQIVPKALDHMMREGSPTQIQHLTQALSSMKKLDMASLLKAYQAKGGDKPFPPSSRN